MAINLWKSVPHGTTMPVLEPYLIESTQPRGAVIVAPGGGYTHYGEKEAAPIAEFFNRIGLHAFVVRYRVAPTRYPEPFQDLLRAIKLVRSHHDEWFINPEQIAMIGFSAGGHAVAGAALLADQLEANAGDAADNFSARCNAVMLGYPVIDIGHEFGYHYAAKELAGDADPESVIEKFSWQKQVTADYPPTFLWHSAIDQCVPVQNSVVFAQKLWQLGVKAELHIFPNGGHGIGLAEEFNDIQVWPQLAAHFLQSSCGFDF